MVARDSWSNPWDLGHGSEWTGRACRPCSPLGTGPETPGTSGRPRRHSEPGPSRPGHLVHPAGPRAGAQVAWETWSPPRALSMGPGRQGHLVDTQASGTVRAARDSGRTLQALGRGPETPRKAVCNRGPSDKVPSLLGPLVDHAGPLERAPVPRDSWSKPPALGARPESPGTASRPRGPSGPGPSPPVVWSSPLARGPGHDSPGTAGQRGTLDQKPRCPGELVDIVGPWVPS